MRRKTRTILALVLLGGLLLVGASRAAAPVVTLERYVIGGGGSRAESGGSVLEGTIGQPVVGRASGGPYELEAGFWAGMGAPRRVFLPVVLRAAGP
jgi:hypothetical protein